VDITIVKFGIENSSQIDDSLLPVETLRKPVPLCFEDVPYPQRHFFVLLLENYRRYLLPGLSRETNRSEKIKNSGYFFLTP